MQDAPKLPKEPPSVEKSLNYINYDLKDILQELRITNDILARIGKNAVNDKEMPF